MTNAQATMRERLVASALALLDDLGPAALSTRKVAELAGTSTMSVYTEFGSMAGLVSAIVDEGFNRLADEFAEVERTEDPVADLWAIGLAYRRTALVHPQLYAAMFGTSSLGGYRRTGQELMQGIRTFDEHASVTRRAIAAGRLDETEPYALALQLWSALHGFVLLELAGFFGEDFDGIGAVLAPGFLNLLVGLGDDRDAATRSLASVPTD